MMSPEVEGSISLSLTTENLNFPASFLTIKPQGFIIVGARGVQDDPLY